MMCYALTLEAYSEDCKGRECAYAALDFNILIKDLFAQNMFCKLSQIGQAPRFTSQHIFDLLLESNE